MQVVDISYCQPTVQTFGTLWDQTQYIISISNYFSTLSMIVQLSEELAVLDVISRQPRSAIDARA